MSRLSVKVKISKLDLFYIKAGIVCRIAARQSPETIVEWVEKRVAACIKLTGPTCQH